MPVFLLPIVVGGYYYLKNKKEEELAMAGESQDESSGTDLPRTPTSSAPATEECPSIEVSLVPSDSEKQPKQHGQHRGSPDDEEEVSIQPVKSQVLSRKESTDTAQTESSDEEIEQPAIGSNSRYGATAGSILSSSCVDCDQVAFFEIVECGNSSDCDNNISTSLRTIIEC